MNSKRWRLLQWSVLLAVGLAPRTGAAQLAPTGGHYASRPSDSGFESGAPDQTGGYSASVPLAIPAPRGKLPMPVQIVYGQRGFGAAGVGWDVPLSYVQMETSFAHRRPSSASTTTLQMREYVTVAMPGRRVELVHKGSTDWVARYGSGDLVMRASGANWTVYDGEGRTFTFTQDDKLLGSGLWLLSTITGPGGASLSITYETGTWAMPGGPAPAVTIDVTRVSYDPHPTTPNCFKHQVDLVYGLPLGAPQSLALVGERVIVRYRKLIRVDVSARASCDAQPVRLHSYALGYQPDPDTQQMRLSTVTVNGRDGTNEATASLPVVSYGYGSATYNGGGSPVLRYQQTQSIPIPSGVDTSNIANTVSDSGVNPPISGNGSSTWQSLTDVTGDGRPDLVYKQNNQLWVARNLPGVSGTTSLGVAAGPLADATLTPVRSRHARLRPSASPATAAAPPSTTSGAKPST